MKTKKIELIDITNENSFYKIVCGDLVIGSLKRSSINKWIIFPELPNFKHMVICSDMDEGISLMEEKLTEFINITTTEKELRVSYSLEEAKKFAMEKFNIEKTKIKHPKGGKVSIDDIALVLEVGVECGYRFGQESGKEKLLSKVQKEVDALGVGGLKQNISDGYHTFAELYEFRKIYNAALFNEWAKDWYIRDEQIKEGRIVHSNLVFANYDVHKSWNHYDGKPCFGGGWFIVVATLPTGQISNHYEAKDWDLFKIPETEKAKHPFDGHTSADVLKRLSAL